MKMPRNNTNPKGPTQRKLLLFGKLLTVDETLEDYFLLFQQLFSDPSG
jgi:hypothetical protein